MHKSNLKSSSEVIISSPNKNTPFDLIRIVRLTINRKNMDINRDYEQKGSDGWLKRTNIPNPDLKRTPK